MSNKGRVLTVRLTITDHEESKWLWDCMLGIGQPKNGIQITAIQNGDLFEESEIFAKAAQFYIREEGESTKDAIEAHCGEGFDDPQDAALAAPKNVSPGAKWDIIDRHGNVARSSS